VQKTSLKGLARLIPFAQPYGARMALAGLFLLLAAAATLFLPVALRQLVDAGLAMPGGSVTGKLAALRPGFLILLGAAIALGVFTAARYYMVTWLGERIISDLRAAVYKNVLTLSPESFDSIRSGEVLSRLTADASLIQTVVGSSFSMGLRNAILFIGGMAMLVSTGPRAAFSVMLVMLICVVPAALIGRRVRKLSRAGQDRLADASAIASEVLGSIAVVQANNQEAREAERFNDACEVTFATSTRRAKVRAMLTAFIIVAVFTALLFGLYSGVEAVLQGRMSAGTLGQTVLYITIVASSSAVLGEVWGDLLRASGASERLLELHELKPSNTAIATASSAQPNPAKAGHQSEIAIQFETVDFAYPTRRPTLALQQLSFTLEKGKTLAVVGTSGAGKTSLLQVLQGFYRPDSGRILVWGQDITQVPLAQLRDNFSVVSQDSSIFSASATENIRYAKPHASEHQVRAAAIAAQANEFILGLPQGYESPLGERGARLSGGQKQRIAIARAILKDAPILLLDEATSALDADSERAVQAALEAARAGRTTIVIAHRLATVKSADRIVVMHHGRIVESGTHEELLALGGRYAGLAALQF
jgi:ATP-binding cassette, subfamily B, bacterial